MQYKNKNFINSPLYPQQIIVKSALPVPALSPYKFLIYISCIFWQQKILCTQQALISQGNKTELEGKVLERKKVFKEDLKELTEVAWCTETDSWSYEHNSPRLNGIRIKCYVCNFHLD